MQNPTKINLLGSKYGKTQTRLQVVHMELFKKELVPEISALAKCDRHNGQILSARNDIFWTCESSRKVVKSMGKTRPTEFTWSMHRTNQVCVGDKAYRRCEIPVR